MQTVFLSAGGAVQAPISARFAMPDPGRFSLVLFEVDTDGDDVFEPLRSVMLFNGAVATCTPDFNNSGTLKVQDIFDFRAAWSTGCP